MAVHMRNGIQYGGIPNGTVKGTTPSTVPTTVKQLNQIGTVGDIAPVTIPSAVKFSNGNTLETAIGSVATIETSPAVATHAVGDYVFYNGQMYKVIAAIAVGETLTVGTNVETASVGDQLTALNNGLNTSVSRIRSVATLLTQRLVPTSNTKYTLSESVSNFALIAVVCGWGNDNVLDTVVMPSAVWSSNKTDVVRLWGNRIPSSNIYVDVKSRTETTLYCQSNNSNVSVGVYGILRVN